MEQLIAVEQVNGHYVAESLTFPELRAEGTTEDLAVARITAKVRARIRSRKIIRINVSSGDFMSHAGTCTGEAGEALQRIVVEAYQQRDAERDAEFPQ